MNFASEATLPSAIERYAVYLNRPVWLDQARMEVQAQAWRSLVRYYGSDHAGSLTTADFEQAILINLASRPGIEVLPPRIVQDACGYATARASTARYIVGLDRALTIYDETVQLEIAIDAADDAEAVAAALARFRAATQSKVTLLNSSGLAIGTVVEVVRWIYDQTEVVAARVVAAQPVA